MIICLSPRIVRSSCIHWLQGTGRHFFEQWGNTRGWSKENTSSCFCGLLHDKLYSCCSTNRDKVLYV
ncbi:hypothetical protein MAR_023345 [Mya arenaria]|uniref:Uncharacterized protein n=1 Tax=Mya arenaria TaxID=6604 RepID=A0ABY7DQH9_MYAAR|nr:hypothetical protein MAR_023345 [Mya arenaria]